MRHSFQDWGIGSFMVVSGFAVHMLRVFSAVKKADPFSWRFRPYLAVDRRAA